MKINILFIFSLILFSIQSCNTDDDIFEPEKEIPEGNGDNDGDGKAGNQRTLTLTLKSAGSLGSYIDEKNINIVENLTLTGNINGTDIKVIRNIKSLVTLDISKTNIVSGGDFYYESFGTINNVISDWMFSGFTNLKEIKLPESSIEIRWLALGGCLSLTHIEIPNKVKKIGNSAIWGCTNLISVKIPDSVIEIDITAFGLCNNLKEVILPNSITKLGNSVFQRCNSLEYVKLSENLEELENGLFNQCGSLKLITIPKKVKIIGVRVFYDCVDLKEIHILNSTPPEISETTFEKVDSQKKFIPKGSLSQYQKAKYWKDLNNLIEE